MKLILNSGSGHNDAELDLYFINSEMLSIVIFGTFLIDTYFAYSFLRYCISDYW